jgi:hypothetical protein
VLGAVAVALVKYRRSGRPVILPPVPHGGFSAWFRGGALARLSALLQRAPFGKGSATTLLGLVIGPLVMTPFVCDGLTLQFQLKSLPLGPRRPPVLSLLLLYVFVLVSACAYIHTIRLVNSALARRISLKDVFDW